MDMPITYGLLEQFHGVVVVCRHSVTFHVSLSNKIDNRKVTVFDFRNGNIYRHFVILLRDFQFESNKNVLIFTISTNMEKHQT